MKAKMKIDMSLKEEESKANISSSETRQYPINPVIVGGSRFIDRRSGSREGRE